MTRYELTTKRNNYTLRDTKGNIIKEWRGLPKMEDVADYLLLHSIYPNVHIYDDVWRKAIYAYIDSLS